MRLGVIGAGTMGRALAAALTAAGHDVRIGSRTPGRVSGFAAGSYRDAACHGSPVFLATQWQHTRAALEQLAGLAGQVLVDCTNPELEGELGLEIGHLTSGAEQIAQWAAGALVVKAFNHVYAELLLDVAAFDHPPSAFLAGDDATAKALVATLAASLGFRPVDAGPLRSARYLEPLAQLMVQLVRVEGHAPSGIALDLLRRPAPA